jgi:hypothetical protein
VVEHQPSKLRVAGSKPVSRSEVVKAEIAQSVEHMHGKHEVTGPIPVLGS